MRLPQDSRGEIRSFLQQELQTPAFLQRFNRLKKSHQELNRFNTPQELIDCFSQSDSLNPSEKNQALYVLIAHYQNQANRKAWLMTLLLLISWKQMARTSYRFRDTLSRINPCDRFAPIYESYIDAFLSVNTKTSLRTNFRIKDRAEYLIRKELKECNRFKPVAEIPAPENLPWQHEIERIIAEWTIQDILTKEEGELVIYHIVYEYTFGEISKKEDVSADALRQRFHRAIEKLKPYLQIKFNIVSQKGV